MIARPGGLAPGCRSAAACGVGQDDEPGRADPAGPEVGLARSSVRIQAGSGPARNPGASCGVEAAVVEYLDGGRTISPVGVTRPSGNLTGNERIRGKRDGPLKTRRNEY